VNPRLGRAARVTAQLNAMLWTSSTDAAATQSGADAHAADLPLLRKRCTTWATSAVARRLLRAVVAALAASISFAVPLASATTNHSLAGAFGGQGLANGLFSGLTGIGVFGASGELFVADTRNGEAPYGRVQRFDASGGFVSSFAFADEPVTAYAGVPALAVDPSGSGAVYAEGREEATQDDVLKFSLDGTFDYLLDQAGSGTTFNIDSGDALAVDPTDGTVYVSATDGTTGAPVVDRFDGSTGAFIDSINGSSSPEGAFLCQLTSLAVGPSHDVYVLDPCKGLYGTGQVDEFAADGTFGAIVDDGSRGAPKAVAVDPVSDEAYVAQKPAEQPGQVFGLLTPHVTQYAAGGGAAISTFDLGSTFGLAPGASGGPGMAVSDAGTVYLANSATEQVARFTKFDGPTVVSGAASVQSAREATVEGTIDPEAIASTYHFEYGNGSSYDSRSVEVAAGAGSGPVTVTATLKGLEPNKTYHYRIVGSNASGSIDGGDQTFATPQAPASVDGPGFASAIGARSARVHGAVNPNSTHLIGFLGEAQYHFEYGTTTAYASTAIGSGGGTVCSSFGIPMSCSGASIPVAAPLSGLLPDTTYHFRVVGDNGFEGPQVGADQTFITAPAAGGGASSVTSTHAALTGTINPHGVQTSFHFNYGQTSAYGASTADVELGSGEGDQRVSLPVSGLSPNTTYHVQVVAVSEDGVTRYGADGLFRTAPAPSAVAIAPVGVSGGAATLTGELNTFGLAGSYHFDVSSPDGLYQASTAERAAAGNAASERVSAPIEGLPPGETFVVRLVASSNDSTTFSDPVTFATPALPRAFPVALAGALASASNTIVKVISDEPDNSFLITRTSIRGSTATVTLKVPGPGKLETSADRTRAAKATVNKAGSASIQIRLTSAASKTLKKTKSHALKVKVTVRFTPAGGKPASKTLTAAFKRKAGR
jgi:hypothetical protein